MATYFTSDNHFGHANILEYSGRPFRNVEEMNEEMISRWNAVVTDADHVYHLGDFCLGSPELAIASVSRLKGQKHLVFGNHDKGLRKNPGFLRRFVKACDLDEVTVDTQRIVLCHYALKTWNQSHRGSWNLHGHSHGSLDEDPNALQLDVGVDCWDYAPVDFLTLRSKMQWKRYAPKDHHGKRPGEV